jgi:hypothetical protein
VGEEGSATASVLFGQGRRNQPATSLIQQSQKVIDGTMLASHRAGTVFLTSRALTLMGEAFFRVVHVSPPIFANGRRSGGYYRKTAK